MRLLDLSMNLKKPKVIVLENVRNFYGHDDGKTWTYVSDTLTSHNYSLVPMILNTSTSTGIPQNRESYIVCFKMKQVTYDLQYLNNERNIKKGIDYFTGSKSSLFLNNLTKNLLAEKKSIEKYLEKNVTDEKYLYTKGKFNTRSAKDGLLIFEELKRSMKDSQTVYQWRRVGEVRANKKGEVPTLTASMGAGGHNVPLILDGKNIRKLTPRECFNFQGFPKSFKLPMVSHFIILVTSSLILS